MAALPDESALQRARAGAIGEWTLAEHLAAMTLDTLRQANWQRSGKGPRPRPIKRPGVSNGATYGKTTLSPRDAASYLVQFAPAHARA